MLHIYINHSEDILILHQISFAQSCQNDDSKLINPFSLEKNRKNCTPQQRW